MKKIVLLLFIIPISLFSQEKLTLSDAIKIGLENNYQVKISAKNVEIADNNDDWGTVGRYPSINFTALSQNRYEKRAGVDQVPDLTTETVLLIPGVTLDWLLFDKFNISIRKDNLEHLKMLEKGSEADIIENSIRDIIQAYYSCLLEKEKLKVIGELTELSRDRYKQAQMKKELGNIVTFDLLQFKNAYLKDSTSFLAQKMALRSALRGLNYLLGEDPRKEYDPSDDFNVVDEAYALDDLIAKMKKSNKQLQNLNINLKMLDNSLEMADNDWLPSLSLRAGTDYSSFFKKDAYSYGYDYYANLTLSFNLYNGGNTARAAQNAQIEREIGGLQFNELNLVLENNLRTQYELFELRKELYKVTLENITSAKLNLDIAKDKFDRGIINSFNYRDIQLMYLSAATDELEAKYNLIESKTILMKLTGGIIAEY